MSLTPEEEQELTQLEAAFEHNGGRGVEDAERIDELRSKRDAVTRTCVLSEADILAGRDDDCTMHEHEHTFATEDEAIDAADHLNAEELGDVTWQTAYVNVGFDGDEGYWTVTAVELTEDGEW